jgi:uncharacterized membrane protein
MTVGPVEYVVLGFPGNEFAGAIAPALVDLVRNGVIRVLDLVFIERNEDGEVQAYEYDDLEVFGAFADLDGEVGGLIGADDIEYVGQELAPNTSVALLLWEDLWAKPLLNALQKANGVMVEGARIPHDIFDVALSELASVG